jgi:hypothetical protein
MDERWRQVSSLPRRFAPGGLCFVLPAKTEDAGNAGRMTAPAASRAMKESTRVSHRSRPKRSASRAIGFNCFLRDCLGEPGFLATIPRDAQHHRELTPASGVPGPHDFAVREPRARVRAQPRPSHPAPNVRDDRDKSLLRARDARASQDVCPSRGSWTGEMIDCLSDLPVGQSTLLGRLSALGLGASRG